VKTAISVPDALFEDGERLAAELRISRSALYARALRELLLRLRSDEIRESWDRAYGDGDPELERALRAAARRTLAREAW
jgi:hypothetical protein